MGGDALINGDLHLHKNSFFLVLTLCHRLKYTTYIIILWDSITDQNQSVWIQIWALKFTSSVTLGKLLDLSEAHV